MTSTTMLGGRFQLRRRLFSEGNQAAYEARDQVRAEEVVVFLIPPKTKLNAETDRAVRADIERAFDVASPKLLPVLDLHEVGEHRFLVMPKPDGANAWTHITQKKNAGDRLGASAGLRAADDLIAAAEGAHARDSTLGFSPKQVWIADDGSARVQYYWIDRVNLTGGGPERFQTAGAEGGYFQAPELSEGSKGATPSADQFFICAVLYGLLTGQVPGGKLEPIRKSRSDVPAPMAKAIERGLAQDPAARHPDLQAFRKAIHRRNAKLGYLVPLLMLLLGLWAGHAAFAGGAGVDAWAFEDEMTERRFESFETSRPKAEPVPVLDADSVGRYAGRYDGGEEHVLWLRTDGSFFLDDHSKDVSRHVRGLWWPKSGTPGALVLTPASEGAVREPLITASVADGQLIVAETTATHRMTKVGWPSESGRYEPLIMLDAPLGGTFLPNRKVHVVGRVAVRDVEVRVAGEQVAVVRTSFDKVIDAPERGDYELVISAKAKDGFEQTLRRTVHIDERPPQITVTATLAEADGVWSLSVKGRCADDGRVEELSVNDEPAPLGADGSFTYVRKGAAATSNAFVEVVAVDDAGRSTRRVVWPTVVAVTSELLAERFTAVRAALADGKTDAAETLLRDIRDRGGLIEDLKPETLAVVVRSERKPHISLDDYPVWPKYYPNDGSMEIDLAGTVDWFDPADALEVGGKRVEVEKGSGRFNARVRLPRRGRNEVPIRVTRDGTTEAERKITVHLAGEDGDVPQWTGVAVSEAQRKASAEFGLPIGRTNDVGMHFVLIPPGTFWRRTAERRFEVSITKPFYMQVGEVSRAQFNRYNSRRLAAEYQAKSGMLPLGDDTHPAMDVTHPEAVKYGQLISDATGDVYRLPTEAEWELAARAGDVTGQTYWGRNTGLISPWANFADQSIRSLLPEWPNLAPYNDGAPGTWPVTNGRANRFGLKNMLGNASEWVSDFAADYDPFDAKDPSGPRDGSHIINRGGSFRSSPGLHGFDKRFSVKADENAQFKRAYIGFRLLLEAEVR